MKTLRLSGVTPYDGSSQHLLKILGDSCALLRLSTLAFLNTVDTGTINLALVADAVIKRNTLAPNSPSQPNCIKTNTLSYLQLWSRFEMFGTIGSSAVAITFGALHWADCALPAE